MKNAKWIWINNQRNSDEYAEFAGNFERNLLKRYIIQISCSSYYVLYINDKIVSFTHCSDFPNFKYFNEVDITKFLEDGINYFSIQVWHEGLDTQRAFNEKAGVIFEIFEDEKSIVFSSQKTLSRQINQYTSNYKKLITTQLGYSFKYDANKEALPFTNSYLINKECALTKRPIKELKLENRCRAKIIKNKDGYLIDLGKEMAGFAVLDFACTDIEKMIISYGEHIIDGGVRKDIDGRDFSFEYISKPGNNKYINCFRRIAGRYLQVYTKQNLNIKFIGIRDVMYPVKINKFDFNDDFVNKVYEISVRTLQLCMHEHYEDCPWREQCLYTMDSSNQIRCGYDCFANGNKDYVRYNFELINKSIRDDGLLCICAPSGKDYPIPSFTLAYLIETSDYIDRTHDLSLINEIKDTVTRIIECFEKQKDVNGLIKEFGSPYWDFYEWQTHCDGMNTDEKGVYSSILNCMYVYAVMKAKKYFDIKVDLEKTKMAIKQILIDNNKVYLYENHKYSSQLSNALGILSGIVNEKTKDIIINDKTLIPATLSMKSFVYDALLINNNDYKDIILNDIKANYSYMLNNDATSFYETILGAADFHGAGSLCHGWSAIPIIYYNKLLKE